MTQLLTVVDTETTGFEAQSNSVVEFAAVSVEYDDHTGWRVTDWYHTLVKPQHRISYGAMAAHHITENMVADAPPLDETISTMLDAGYFGTSPVFVAHNAKFDKSFLPHLPPSDWICTWKCACDLYPDAESHSNQALRYELGLDVSHIPTSAGGVAHRALFDAHVTARLLIKMLRETSLDYLRRVSARPVLLKKLRFGKHFGEAFDDVPRSYLQWMLTQDFDEDTIYSAEVSLGRRVHENFRTLPQQETAS